MNEINIINDNLEKCNSKINIKAKLKSEEEEINTILEYIKKLEICYNEVNEDDQKDLDKEEKKGDEKKWWWRKTKWLKYSKVTQK